jgi:hypothetical protein
MNVEYFGDPPSIVFLLCLDAKPQHAISFSAVLAEPKGDCQVRNGGVLAPSDPDI